MNFQWQLTSIPQWFLKKFFFLTVWFKIMNNMVLDVKSQNFNKPVCFFVLLNSTAVLSSTQRVSSSLWVCWSLLSLWPCSQGLCSNAVSLSWALINLTLAHNIFVIPKYSINTCLCAAISLVSNRSFYCFRRNQSTSISYSSSKIFWFM